MVSNPLVRLIHIPVVQDWAIVATEDHKRVLCEVKSIQSFQNFADRPIELDDDIAPWPHRRFADKAGMWNPGNVDVVGRKVQKEWTLTVLFDEPHALIGE